MVVSAVVQAQQPAKVPRIGFVTAGSSSTIAARIEALRQGLRDLGYVEDKNIIIEWRFAEGKVDRLSGLVAELVRLKVDVLLSAGAAVTGLSSYSAELNGKRVELLKEIVTKLSRLAVIGQSTYPGNAQSLKETELAAEALKLQLQYLDVLGPEDIETAFREARKTRAGGVLVLQNNVLNSQRKQTADLAIKNRLPTIYYAPEFLDSGGLISYAASINDLYRRSATYVDKILKGAKAADLPVEQPIKFEFIINLKAAKQIGLTIPPNVLARADKVIR